jgi:hypothetical protein
LPTVGREVEGVSGVLTRPGKKREGVEKEKGSSGNDSCFKPGARRWGTSRAQLTSNGLRPMGAGGMAWPCRAAGSDMGATERGHDRQVGPR